MGGVVDLVFTSTWTGPARIEVCEAPRHLLLTTQPGTEEECEIEAWLTEEGAQTRLVVEERGLPRDELPLHGAGWQAHLEDLGASLATGASVHPDGWASDRQSPAWQQRWEALSPMSGRACCQASASRALRGVWSRSSSSNGSVPAK